jgi:hypothetical protein
VADGDPPGTGDGDERRADALAALLVDLVGVEPPDVVGLEDAGRERHDRNPGRRRS